MATDGDARGELEELAARFRHLRAEHGRAPAGGRVRRRLEADMREAAARLDRRLGALVPDAADRAAWRDHAHHGSAAPERPAPAGREPPGAPPPERPSGRRPWPLGGA